MKRIRYTVQVFVESSMKDFTAYDGLDLGQAASAHRAVYSALQIGRGTADVYWRENDVVLYKLAVVNGKTIKNNGFDKRSFVVPEMRKALEGM